MPRVLTAPAKSTPTFLFSITDADSSGVDFTDMKAMMCLRFTSMKDTETHVDYVYVVPNINIPSLFPGISQELFWMDDSYSRLFSGNSTFAITIPLWRYHTPTDYVLTTVEYQVFLFSNLLVHGTSSTIKMDGTIDTNPGKIAHHNIMIDDGTIELTESFFPLMYAAEMAQDISDLYTYLTPSEVSLVGSLDTSAWEKDDETSLGSAVGMSKEIITVMFKLIPKYDLDDPPLTPSDLSHISLDKAHTIFAADIAPASNYASRKLKRSVT